MSLLRELGVDIESRDNRGRSALMQASISDKPVAIAELLRLRLDANTRDNSGCTSRMRASMFNSLVAACALLKGRGDVGAAGSLLGWTCWRGLPAAARRPVTQM